MRITALVLLAGASLVGACKMNGNRPSGGGEPAIDPKTPVARVGSSVITAGELEIAARPQVARLEAQIAEQAHGAKAQALDQLVEKRLLEDRAKKEGVTPEKLIEREVTSKLPEPSEADVQGMYDRAKGSGRELPPFEQVKGEIVKVLKERTAGEARKAYIDRLAADAKVTKMMPPLLPPKVEIAAEGPSKGADKGAPITIVEFSDFQCPFCSRAEEVVNRVMDTYKGKIRLVYRDYPLPFHGDAQKASEAALCAGEQGKYWEMHSKLFANQQALTVPQLKDHAKGLGLDDGKFGSCLDGGAKAKEVAASKKAGDEAGVNGTPAFFINGRLISGAQPFDRFKEIIDHELGGSARL
jgi:protein-disulfide isomerase